MVSLADFPEHRRMALVFRYALEHDYAGVEELVAAGADRPCFPQPRGNKPTAGDLLRIERVGFNPFQR